MLDEASRLYFEETTDLKQQITRLEDLVQVLERKNENEEALSREKSASFESHIRML